jgi:hypothetical protein
MKVVRTKYPVAIWQNADDRPRHAPLGTYAFPIGAEDPWGGKIMPMLDDTVAWRFVCVLPAGAPAADVRHVEGHRVECKLAGKTVFTGDWALEEAEAVAD